MQSNMLSSRSINVLISILNISAGQLIAVYSGYLLHVDKETYYANMTIDDREDVHKNWLHYNDTYMIDVLNLDLPKST